MSDARITKEALANALKTLMEKKSFNKIRISEIVELCHLERQTFYYHFEDKYALAIWIFQRDMEHVGFPQKETTLQNVIHLCSYFDEQRMFYRNLFLNGEKRIFRDMLYQTLYDRFYSELSQKGNQSNVEYCAFVSDYLATGTCGVLIQWLLNENHMDTDSFSRYLLWIHEHIFSSFEKSC